MKPKSDMMMKTTCLALTLCACLLAGCGERRAEPPLRSVMVAMPEPVGSLSARSYNGIVKEAREISLGFKTPGQISRVAVSEGQRVSRGQLIATLDDADYRLGVEAARVQYSQMADELRRLGQLHSQNGLSDNDYQKAVAGLEQLRIQLQANKNKLDYTRLYAPVDGIVAKVNFDEAEMVDAGTPVVTLLDVSAKEVEADVPAGVYADRERIVGITCRPLSVKGQPARMKVASLTPKADANQLYRLRLGFEDGPQPWLTAGMNVAVELSFAGGEGAGRFCLPQRAVFQQGGRTFVWTVGRDGRVHKTAVTLGGITPGGRVVVTSGLGGGERVVRAGVGALRDGERVSVIADGSPTNAGNLL